jgi:multiple sugar transport system ATP-binding protein
MRASLAQLHARLGTTTVYVTHDQVEAMTLGQRVAVMRDGRILQVDEPPTLYARPIDLYVAAFIGSPAMNLVEATVDGDWVSFGQYRAPLDPVRRPAVRSGDRVVLGIRPEAFEDADFAPDGLPTIEARIEVLEELGSDAHAFFEVAAPSITAEGLEAAEDDDSSLLARDDALFTARVDERTRARVGRVARLAVDPARFHFFDPRTGASLLAADGTSTPAETVAVAT